MDGRLVGGSFTPLTHHYSGPESLIVVAKKDVLAATHPHVPREG
jgi:hypothetical protein